MLKQFLEIGQIVSTHGIKGEVRLNPWCDSPDFLKKFKTLYFDGCGEKKAELLQCRPHGNVVILKIKGIDTVEDASLLRNKVLFMNRADAHLQKGDWFIQDLIDCKVYDSDNEDIYYGTLTDVSETGANDVWHITDEKGNEYLLPAIKDVVISVDVENEKILIKPLKGIFEDAD